MPPPKTTDELVELVRKTGVLDDKRLDAYLESLRSGRRPRHCWQACRAMVHDGILTNFQAEQVTAGPMAAVSSRQVQDSRKAGQRRHGQRLPVRTQVDAPARRRQGVAVVACG